MAKKVLLEYMFFFEPSSQTWTSVGEFETSLARFFASHGLEAETVDIFGTSNSRKVILITPKKVYTTEPKMKPKNLSLDKQFKNLAKGTK